jgi:hypothetical protein
MYSQSREQKTIEKASETKTGFFEKVNKTVKLVIRLRKKENQITKS